MKKSTFTWLKWVSEIQAIAQAGLTYSNNQFDIERYIRLREIAAALASTCSTQSAKDIETIFSLEKGYATPKLDVRAVILKNTKLLFVKERCDDLWSLPGGWADVNESPAEAVIRETKEETGYDIVPIKLLALWDKLKHDHPPQWPHAYKCFFLCEIKSDTKTAADFEITDQQFFDVQHLPALSLHRVTPKQINRLYELAHQDTPTQFD